jgi:hypothetical protein
MKTIICPQCQKEFEPEPEDGPLIEYSTHLEASIYIGCPFCDFELRVTFDDEKFNFNTTKDALRIAFEQFCLTYTNRRNKPSLSMLMQLAHEVGQAKKNGESQEKINEKEKRLREYEKLCLEADEMSTNLRLGDLL